MALMLPTMLLSCSDNNNEPNEGEMSAAKQAIIAQCVNNVVVPTYKSLADASMDLASVCADLKENPTQENVNKACEKWVEARKYWELSEAFLYGAASDYNIDPHIDSWPLQKSKLDQTLSNADLFAELDTDGSPTSAIWTQQLLTATPVQLWQRICSTCPLRRSSALTLLKWAA